MVQHHDIILSTSQLSDAFFCAICFNTFKRPKILPSCGHCFCYLCIESWYRCDGAATGILKCPVCRRSVNLKQKKPKKGVLAAWVRCLFRKIPECDRLSCYLDDCQTAKLAAKLRSRTTPAKEAISAVYASPDQHLLSLTVVKKSSDRKDDANDSSGTTGSPKKFNLCDFKSSSIVRDRLTCQICKFILDDPRMLPGCQHSFCLSCLQMEYKQGGSEKGIINCASCDKSYRLDKIMRSSCGNAVNNCKAPSLVQLATILPFDYVLSVLLENFRGNLKL